MRELRGVEGEQGPRDQLGDPATGLGLAAGRVQERSVVDRLDQLDARLEEQWAQQGGHEVRSPLDQIGVQEGQHVTGRDVECLPQCLALALSRAEIRPDVAGPVDDRSGRSSALGGGIDAVRVDHHQFIDQGHLIDPCPAHDLDHRAHRALLVAGGDDDGHVVPAAVLGGEQVLDTPRRRVAHVVRRGRSHGDHPRVWYAAGLSDP